MSDIRSGPHGGQGLKCEFLPNLLLGTNRVVCIYSAKSMKIVLYYFWKAETDCNGILYVMKTIKIQFDYTHGPIWKDHFNPVTGEWSTGIAVIDEDKALQLLDAEASRIYSSFYSFDEKEACTFDQAAYDAHRGELLSLIQTIILRLTILNDGSYCILDEETGRLKGSASAA